MIDPDAPYSIREHTGAKFWVGMAFSLYHYPVFFMVGWWWPSRRPILQFVILATALAYTATALIVLHLHGE
jgi:hypothetical protein